MKETTECFDAIIVLGYAVIKNKKGEAVPGFNAKIRTIAAAEAYRNNMTETLIFTGGRTSGENLPSEAQAMSGYLQKKYKKESGKFSRVPDDKIFLEEEATNSSTNLKNSWEIIHQKFGEQARIGVLTNDYHLPRVVMQAKNLGGLTVEPVSAEQLLTLRNKRFRPIMNKSIPLKAARAKEHVRRLLVHIDPQDKLSGHVTRYIRGKGNLNIRALKTKIKETFTPPATGYKKS